MDVVSRLKRCLLNEFFAPEILTFEADLVERIQEAIRNQENRVGELNTTIEGKFKGNLYQLEINRLNYLLREYFRKRIEKIENHVMFILKDAGSRGRLSALELDYAQRYADMLHRHLQDTVLNSLPAQMRSLVEPHMIPQPDLSGFVFCEVKKDIGEYQINPDDDPVLMEEGDIFVIPYKSIRPLVGDKIALC